MKRLASAVVAALLLLGPVASSEARAQIHERIYPAPKQPLDLAGLPSAAQLITVKTEDGLALRGVEAPPREGKPTFLIFHGNGSSATNSVRWLAPLVAEGYGVVAAEYREYSGNPGRASEKGLAADADAFFDRARVVAGSGKLIVVGHSLGGGVAFGLASRRKLDGLVTIGTFTRLSAMAPAIARPLLTDRYDNKGAIASLDEPLFLIHGDADPVIPYGHGEALKAEAVAAHRQGAMFTVLGAGHGPNSATLAMVLKAIATKVEGGEAKAQVTLPANVRLAPF
ncbi:alpha/beta hydrolase [Caulobacter endophyticus]|uniref:Alpha/beta hydrolase n=1 Tax=Caulobacter endophyticus TaxID=2172652 RepID=A0A2T9K2W1_9CAUL|nr:alpha/beta fold hydrolase [Caulobacter endophyticus]PVM90151.1 alpha/beta hydrolase [Caulobacter endophyticus]